MSVMEAKRKPFVPYAEPGPSGYVPPARRQTHVPYAEPGPSGYVPPPRPPPAAPPATVRVPYAEPGPSGYVPPAKQEARANGYRQHTSLTTPPLSNQHIKKHQRHSTSSFSSAESAPARLGTPDSRRASTWSIPSPLSRFNTTRSLGSVIEPPVFGLQWEIINRGSKPGQLRQPEDVCFLSAKQIAVTEAKNSRIQIFNGYGNSIFCIDKESEPGLASPTCMDTNSDATTLFVSDMNQIYCFETINYESVGNVMLESKSSIHGLCIDKHNDFIISNLSTKPEVFLYDVEEEKIKSHLKPKTGEFGRPAYVQCCPWSGRIHVSDSSGHCIHMFDKHGRFMKTYGNSNAQQKGNLLWPSGLVATRNGNVLVVDRGNHRVTSYSADGEFMYHVITEGHGLRDPVGVDILEDQTLAITTQTLGFNKKDSYGVKLYQIQH